MSEWLNELPFAWLLIAVLALSYIAATAVYTRVMMLVIDRRGRTPARTVRSDATIVERSSLPESAVEVTPSARADNSHRTETGWDRLTLDDIERVKRALATRRADALARHAEELKKLDAEQAEIEAIELAINSFAKRYGHGTPKGTS